MQHPIIRSIEAILPSKETDYEQLEHLLEQRELQETSIPLDSTQTLHYYILQLLTYFQLKHLQQARHLWHRIPDEYKKMDPILDQIWQIGKCLYTRNLEGAYEAMTQQWPESIQPWIINLKNAIRDQTASLIARAYTSVPIDYVRQALGFVAEQQAIEYCELRRWQVNRSSSLVFPEREQKTVDHHLDLDQLEHLAQCVAYLERQTTLNISSCLAAENKNKP